MINNHFENKRDKGFGPKIQNDKIERHKIKGGAYISYVFNTSDCLQVWQLQDLYASFYGLNSNNMKFRGLHGPFGNAEVESMRTSSDFTCNERKN